MTDVKRVNGTLRPSRRPEGILERRWVCESCRSQEIVWYIPAAWLDLSGYARHHGIEREAAVAARCTRAARRRIVICAHCTAREFQA